MSVEELVADLACSESTIRRDLDELEQIGALVRVHGGAIRLDGLDFEATMSEKSGLAQEEKEKLAQLMIRLIQPSDVLFLDAGSTTMNVIPYLEGMDVTVVTHSIHHAARLVDLGIHTIVIGGRVKQSTDAAVGSMALDQLKALRFDKAILGINGVTENGYTTPDPEEAAIKRTVLARSAQSYVIADSSKIGKQSFVTVAALGAATLVTSSSDSMLLKTMKEQTEVMTE